jgi:hypothetical protein
MSSSVRNPEEKRPRGRLGTRWEDNIKVDREEMSRGRVGLDSSA